MQPLRVLILGGTSEASALARALASEPRIAPTLSLAGRTAAPAPSPISSRIGGFGGVDGLSTYLREHRIEALIDATHPFAAIISRHAALAAGSGQVPLLAVRRPAWVPQPGDRWIFVADPAAAAAALGVLPRRVVLTIGRQELAPFAAAPWHDYLVRSVDPINAALLPRCRTATARGPFELAHELRLLAAHRAEVLVTKNSGGVASGAKLAAARQLGMTVVMVTRPAVEPDTAAVETAEAALAWLHHCLATRRGA